MSKLALDRLVLHTAMMLNRGVAGLVDALEGYDSMRHAAVEQSVFAAASLRIADSRRLMEGRRQAGRFQNAPVLLNDRSAKWRRASAAYQARKSFNAPFRRRAWSERS
jgi:hypothetical protein